jgi:hypothetical protein
VEGILVSQLYTCSNGKTIYSICGTQAMWEYLVTKNKKLILGYDSTKGATRVMEWCVSERFNGSICCHQRF